MKVLAPSPSTAFFVLCIVCAALCISAANANNDGPQNTEQWDYQMKELKNSLYGRKSVNSDLGLTPRKYDEVGPKAEGEMCGLCRALLTTLMALRRFGASKDTIAGVATTLCVASNLAPEHVCSGMINSNIDIFLFIVDSRFFLTPYTICGVVFQGDRCELGLIGNEHLQWTINIDEAGRRPINESKHEIPAESAQDLRIVHITDTHFDPHYREGANAVCGEPACCRVKQGNATLPENAAGRWGDYRDCDTPWEAVQDVFERIRANHERIDYVYYTGDVIDHGSWETSTEENTASILRTFEALYSVFGDIPIFPIIGNHEPHPMNQFAPAQIDQSRWETVELYSLLADTWSWLPEQALETIRYAGYYTILVRDNLRIIALNNNEGYTYNWWLLYDARYAAAQLQWLHDTLLEAERNGEKVHILAHIPAAYRDVLKSYSREYNRIVDRFWDTISAQFNGHTHNDQFTMFYARDQPNVAVNVAWNGGSATAYSDVNPNYRVYSVDQETYQVTDHETWIYNLTAANLNREELPEWFHEYSFGEAYGVTDLSPASLDQLLTTFATDHQLLHLYWQHKMKMGDPMLEAGCDSDCLLYHLCDITKQYADPAAENWRCNQLVPLFWSNV